MSDAAPQLSSNGLPRWNHSHPRSILSGRDLEGLVYRIRDALHHTSGIPACHRNDLCAMCGNAVRLVVQAAEPMIIDAAITKMAAAVGRNRIDIDPPFRGED